MIRSVIAAARAPFSCLTRVLQQQLSEPAVMGSLLRQSLHSSPALLILDKDKHKHKKLVDEKTAPETVTPTAEELSSEEFMPNTVFPTLETHGMLIHGQPYYNLPIVHIKASRNNTILTTTDGKGVPKCWQSGGTVGLRNARKGTNMAAQAAGIALGELTLKQGIDVIRVKVKGVGPGRLPAIKGLQMAGLKIVSITDNSLVPHFFRKPRKQRRL